MNRLQPHSTYSSLSVSLRLVLFLGLFLTSQLASAQYVPYLLEPEKASSSDGLVATSLHSPVDEDSIYGRYELHEVVVASNRSTNNRNLLPVANAVLHRKELLALSFKTISDLSGRVPNVWMPRYGSTRSTPIYIRGIGSRSGTPSASVYLDGSPIIYGQHFAIMRPQLQQVTILRGPQGTLYGRNSLAGVVNLQSYSPFNPQLGVSQLVAGSHGQYRANSSFSLFQNSKIAASAFFELQRRDGFFYNLYKKELADPSKGASFGGKFAWRINEASLLGVNLYGGFLSEGAFPYSEYNHERKEITKVAYDGNSTFTRESLIASLYFTHTRDQYSFDVRSSLEFLDERTTMDQDYSPRDIFQTSMRGEGLASTLEALFKWRSKSERHRIASGISFFIDRNRTDNPIRLGKDGIAQLLNPVLGKVSENPKLPYKLSAASTTEHIALSYKKPRIGVAVFAQYTLQDLFTKGLSITLGTHLGYEHYKLDYEASSAFSFLAEPKQPTSKLKALALNPQAMFRGELAQGELHISPRIALSYELPSYFSTYLSYSRGYRAGNFNEQTFADLLLQQQIKALMAAMAQKQLPPQAVEKEVLLYQPERGNNLEWGIRGSHLDNRISWGATLFYMWINNLQVTDFVASGLGRVQENYQKGTYRGVELSLRVEPIRSLSFSLSYGFVDARATSPEGGFRIPYVPMHTLSAGGAFSPRLDRRTFFFEELSFGLLLDAAGPTVWRIGNTFQSDFKATLSGQLSARRGSLVFWLHGYNLTASERIAFSVHSLGRTLVEPFPPLRFECGITLFH